MRPIRLTMSAFGSYAGRVDIDMDALGREGLYLICGDTGSGKSTIFDGICYALYGQTSGMARRDGEVLRSELAGPGVKSYVELQFEHAGQTYTILRSLKYPRKALRGEGVIVEESNAALTLPDGRQIEGKREVAERVEDILHLKYEHFSRIMMIAQGEFSQLLMADTEARGRILQKICNTEKHRALQSELFSRAKALEDARVVLAERLKGGFGYAECAQESPHRAALESLKAQPAQYRAGALITLLEDVEREDLESIGALEAEEKAGRARVKELSDRLAALEAVAQARAARAKALLAAQAGRAALPALEAAVHALAAREPEIDILRTVAARLEADLPAYDELDKSLCRCKEMRTRRAALEGESSALKLDEKVLRDARDTAQREAAALADAPAALADAENERKAVEDRGKAVSLLRKRIGELATRVRDVSGEQAKLVALSESAQTLEEKLSHMRRELLLHQAGILADRLSPGVPCPVCGAAEHPHPAQRPASSPTEEQVERAEAEARQAAAQTRALSEKIVAALGGIAADRAQISQALCEYTGKHTPFSDVPDCAALSVMAEQARAALLERYQEANRTVKGQKARSDRLAALQREESGRAQALEQKTGRLRECAGELGRLDGALSALEESVAARRAALPYAGKTQAEEALSAQKKQIQAHCDALSGAKLAFANARAELLANERQLALLDEQLQKQTEVVFPEQEQTLRAEHACAEQTLVACVNKRALVAGRLTRNRQLAQKMCATLAEFEALDHRCAIARLLSDTANGRLRGCDKLTFERYVQIDYFENVLRMANQRFLQMTGGQYALERACEADNQRAQSGLDLNVFNHFTDKRRSVKSLSGGESFMASLSLALGFSDVIRQEAGGVVIDALFIDEGFGALDEEALNQVLEALTRLSGGGKLIGIISHVRELRSRIDRQIVVNKTRAGSTARVLC